MAHTDRASIDAASFDSPSKFKTNANPFAIPAGPRPSPFKQQSQPPPPHSSFFNPQLQHRPSAPQFRNPAFTTPQKRVDELAYADSGAETSPAMTDTSEFPADTPEVDREQEDFGRMTITQQSANRNLFGKSMVRSRTPGRGEIPRGNRDKVRKRKRQQGDRDVGSVRSRLPHGSDDSDSDWEDGGVKKGKSRNRGWVANFLAAVSDHPSAPAILSKWLQLGVNVILLGLVLIGIVAIVSQVRSDLAHASEKARAAIVHEMAQCSENYIKNQCSPRASRAPALEGPCNEWEACMNQDASAIMKVQVSARNVAEIMNEFVGVLTFKTWGFIMSLFLVAVVASNIGFGFLRESALAHAAARPTDPLHSPPASLPMLGSGMHDPRQAYIWAPIGETPRHVRRGLSFANNDGTDTENSPDPKAILPPQTPSGRRRSPSKQERGRSPSKATRSPSKGF
ncbi:Di-sulfide bridge nucleocytoplasmic transport domain-containing protein [Apodospora peruviana]|uniref:Di-sulfide bridge nucleocytoplasmic transport domain-containing protein n=1 Tax=Apodospora peruviana TaxID=516989 RepID=A0AAE0IT18_9PEZI|nr:Di-sulfide bridge nucleocytoplasmic transport domain-containing protein [Apodospora peruviana]